MPGRRDRKELESDVRLLIINMKEALKGTPDLFEDLSTKELYDYEKALITATKALKRYLYF